MRSYHWGMILLFLIVGYLAGVWFPAPGVAFRSKIGM
jgi:hypothetical protein